MTSLNLFYQSHLVLAAQHHECMAKMQRASGQLGMADGSKKVAMARRIAASDLSRPDSDLIFALDYGEWAASQEI